MDSRFGYISVIDDNIALRVLAPTPAMSRVYGDAEGALRRRGPAVLSNYTMAGAAASLPTSGGVADVETGLLARSGH
jgi:hypothetical protein